MAAREHDLFAFLLIISVLLINVQCNTWKLNVPKLLLPYQSEVATNFTLEVRQGCFTWESTRPEIAAVAGVGVKDQSQCTSQAVVTATSRVSTRKTAIIMAQDQVSGQPLRCDVIVDAIEAIEIITTTKELYLDDTPEMFEVQAINTEDDVFSSLDGLEFEWNILPDTDQESIVPARNVLRFLKFSESNYEAPPVVRDLEERGKRGDKILVRGKQSGSARVSVKLVDKQYKNVKESIVRIIVIANIQLNPPLVYLLQHTRVAYKVELLKQGKTQLITMPSQQYLLEVIDSKIASLETETSVATALEYGDTEVVLRDRNIKMTGTFRVPSAAIYVVTPSYLEFDIFPGRNWVIQVDQVYEIHIQIYDKESHKIYPAEGIRVAYVFPVEYFEVLSSSLNGTYHVVRTKKRGFTTIEGELNAVVHTDGTKHTLQPTVEGTQEVEIYDPVSVLPKRLVLPWDPLAKTVYQYQLKAAGGSGNYSWLSDDTKIATVTGRGLITAANTVGHTTVSVSDARNPAHYDSMEIFVLPPGELKFIPSRVEAELDTELGLPLAVIGEYEGKKYRFDRCDLMPFDTAIADTGVFEFIEVGTPIVKGSCANVKVMARNLGHTEVTSLYRYKDGKRSAMVTIAAYKPLKPVDPEEVAVVTQAASKEVIFEGGPQPWVLDKSRYYQNIEAEHAELLSLTPVKAYDTHKSFHIFHVTCLRTGEQVISLEVGNQPTTKNTLPASSTASVRFVCADPKRVQLIPLVPQPSGLPPCPVSHEFDDPVPALCYRPLDMAVHVYDEEGRHFDNFSSLALDWELGNEKLGSFPDGKTKLQRTEKGQSYKTIATAGQTGRLTVTVSVTQYNPEYFGDKQFQLALSTPIKTERELDLVQDAVIDPEYLALYNHATNTASLQLSQGSGHYHLDYSNDGLAHVDYDRKTRNIKVTPAAEGTLTVTAFDLCLDVENPAKATVFVSDVNQILLSVVDKVELNKEILAKVQVLDRKNQAISAKYFSMMNLKAKTGSDIISLRPSPEKAPDDITAVYIVRGVSLGRTPLQFLANQKSGRMIASQNKEIQVFPPLRLDPRNITLIIGALFQVTAHGGPQPESTIEFSIENQTVAMVSSSGLIDSREIGVTKVTGKAVGVDEESGHVVYSQDEVTVNVVELVGIRLHAPIKRLQTDTQMPIYVMGINENESPFSFGSAVPQLAFHWTISNSDVAQLQPLFHKSGLQPPTENNFAQRFAATEPGHVTVKVTVESSSGSQMQLKDNAKMTDSVTIQVFERLQVISPQLCDGVFLMTPNTDAHIKTNRHGSSAKVTFTVLDRESLTSNRDPVVMVTESGHVTSLSNSGEASLLIRSQEDFGVNQSLVVLVKVKPVSYLMLNADTIIRTRGQHLTALPVGSTLHFTVSFHDNVGAEFYATNSKIKYRPNRYDLLQISYGNDNNTLVARATNIGQTVLKVWDKTNPQLADYVSIRVGSAITPSEVLVTVGDIICFSSPVVGDNGQPGSWMSSSNAIHLEQFTAVGVAAQVGTALVSYTPTPHTTTHTQVVVSPVTRVTLKNEHLQYLTNVVTKNQIEVVQIALEGLDINGGNIHGANCSERLQEQNFQAWRLPFYCEVTMTTSHPHLAVQDLVKTSEVFDVKTGSYQCRLMQQTVSPDIIQVISSLDTSIQLRAIVHPREGQPEVSSSVLSLPFVPAFYVHTGEIHLSNLLTRVNLRVSATDRVLQDIKVTSSDETLVKVLAQERSPQADYIASYPIALQLSSSLWTRNQLDASIEVRCLATGQIQIVPVKIKLLGEQGTQVHPEISWTEILTMIGNHYHTIVFMALCIIATISCIVIAYHAVIGSRYQAAASQSNIYIPQGASPQPQSPMSQSPWASPSNLSHSPTRLWSVDTGPFDGSGIFKRSPLNRSTPRN